jgi:hypothetical protein
MKRARLPRCILDSGGLTALTGRDQGARGWLRWLVRFEGQVIVPTPILVECITGNAGRDAEINRILGSLASMSGVLRPPHEATARLAGALRFAARSDDGIDALVAAEAASEDGPAVLLTSDPRDLSRLLAKEPRISVRRV